MKTENSSYGHVVTIFSKTSPQGYFSEGTMNHLVFGNETSSRWKRRAVEVSLACKLTLVYGRYHMMSDLQSLAMNDEQTSYSQAEVMADFLNQLVPMSHTLPSDFMKTKAEYIEETIDVYKEYEHYLSLFEGDCFFIETARRFCETVYAADDYYTFKTFSNLDYSIYAETMLLYQMGGIDYLTFVNRFQRISLFDGRRDPLKKAELDLYIRTMRKIVNLYMSLLADDLCHSSITRPTMFHNAVLEGFGK